MRVVNRTAVTITGVQPFIDWMRETDADFNRGAIPVPRAKAYGSVDVADDDIEGEGLSCCCTS